MRETTTNPARLLGVVQLRVGAQVFAVPVEALDFASDGTNHRGGGFFVRGDEMGILVDGTGTPAQMQEQLAEACAEAVRHLAARHLN